jgi:hypothetical protein
VLPEGVEHTDPSFAKCALETRRIEVHQRELWRSADDALKVALGPEVKLVRLTTVDGRLIIVIDHAIPIDLLEHFFYCLQDDAFRRTEFARPDTRDFRHGITEYNTENLRKTRLYSIVSAVVNTCFPQRPHAPLEAYRIYTNAVLFGDVGFVHRDHCDHEHATVLLYPCLKWVSEYGGETFFYDEQGEIIEAVEPRPGRLVVFHGSILHKGAAPSRLVFGSRYTTAFKFAPEDDT